MREENKKIILNGALWLGISTIILKIIGLIYKVPMSYILGDEGMGYFNSAYTVYTFFYIISSSGIPKAVSIICAKVSEGEAKSIFKSVFRIYFMIGIALSIMDRSVIAHNGLRQFVEKICKENKIPYTLDVLPAGGTDSGEIHKSFDGIINMTISVPCRYFHSHISVVDLEDYNNLVKVITLISKKIDSKVLKELREFKK